MSKNKNNKIRNWYDPIVHFATHAFIGSAIFIIISLVAVGLGLYVEVLKDWGATVFTLLVFHWLERVILLVDAALFLVYLVRTAMKSPTAKRCMAL